MTPRTTVNVCVRSSGNRGVRILLTPFGQPRECLGHGVVEAPVVLSGPHLRIPRSLLRAAKVWAAQHGVVEAPVVLSGPHLRGSEQAARDADCRLHLLLVFLHWRTSGVNGCGHCSI